MSDIVKSTKVKKTKQSTIILFERLITTSHKRQPNYKVQLTNEHHISSKTGNLAFFLLTICDVVLGESFNPKALIFTIDQYELALKAFNDITECKSVKLINETFKRHQNGTSLMNAVTAIGRYS